MSEVHDSAAGTETTGADGSRPSLDPQSHAQRLWLCAASTCSAARLPSSGRRFGPAHSRPDRPLRVLDVASGGGDVTWAFGASERENLPLEIVGLDMSAVAVGHARSLAAGKHADVEFRVGNVVDAPLPGDFDVIMTSLFLHHLPRADAVRLLAAMSQSARRLVVVNDLHRSTIGYLLAQAICRLVTRSPIVHVDGAALGSRAPSRWPRSARCASKPT